MKITKLLEIMQTQKNINGVYPSSEFMFNVHSMNGPAYSCAIHKLIEMGYVKQDDWDNSKRLNKQFSRSVRKHHIKRERKISNKEYTPMTKRAEMLLNFIYDFRKTHNGTFPTNRIAGNELNIPRSYMSYAMKEFIKKGIFTSEEYRNNSHVPFGIKDNFLPPISDFKEISLPRLIENTIDKDWKDEALDIVMKLNKNPHLRTYIHDYLY